MTLPDKRVWRTSCAEAPFRKCWFEEKKIYNQSSWFILTLLPTMSVSSVMKQFMISAPAVSY